ncbi:MAG: hypothetical protein ACXABX_03920 [Candidatus Thorarchaeota archaeon]
MTFAEHMICWISADLDVASDWSQGDHITGQLVSETAYQVTNP